MHNDDRQAGRILTRREALALLGTAGAGALIGCSTTQTAPAPTEAPAAISAPTATARPSAPAEAQTATVTPAQPTEAATVAAGGAATPLPACVVRPETTEGPYYVDEQLVRSDIRSDPATGAVSAGAPLLLTFRVSQVADGACSALPGATIDIWHCDAAGVYSDVTDRSFDTRGQKFLRGSQVTDASGVAQFTTIYPGWYPGRAVHIHFKIHPDADTVFTSQLFFDDDVSDQVFAAEPYARRGRRTTRNSNDGIYQDQLVMMVSKAGQGYAATFEIGIDRSTLGG